MNNFYLNVYQHMIFDMDSGKKGTGRGVFLSKLKTWLFKRQDCVSDSQTITIHFFEILDRQNIKQWQSHSSRHTWNATSQGKGMKGPKNTQHQSKMIVKPEIQNRHTELSHSLWLNISGKKISRIRKPLSVYDVVKVACKGLFWW